MKRMNEGVIKAKIIPLPILENLIEEQEPERPSWWIRFWIWAGVLMTKPESPRGFGANPATITLSLTILFMVAGGAYYVGQKDAESRQILERLAVAEKKAEQADTKATYAVSGKDKEEGHGPNTSKEKAK